MERIETLANIGTAYAWMKEYEKGYEHLKRALDLSSYDPDLSFPYDNVNIRPTSLMIKLYFLAQNQQYHYADGGTLAHLKNAHKYQAQYLDLLEYISKNLSSSSIRYFIDRYYYMYEEAIYVRYKLYEETQDPKYLTDAFYVAGRAKAMQAKEAAQNAAAEKTFPSTLLQRRQALRAHYVSLETQLYEKQEAGVKNPILADSALTAKNNFYKYIDSLEKAFPTLQQMWNIPAPPAIEEVQARLNSEERTMAQYFIGFQYIFLFILDGKDIMLYHTKIPEGLAAQVNTMRDALYEWALAPSDELIQAYTESAHWLYKQLLAPVDSLLSFRLLIVPDNYVAYLPFDALLQSEVSPNASFHELPYLINSHQISYAYSPFDFTRHNKKPKHRRREILGFAPSFPAKMESPNDIHIRRREFGPLLANEKEVEQIAALFTTKQLQAGSATKSVFLETASDYQVLHLATHAKANDKKGQYSYLCFTETPGDTAASNRLYARELYQMHLPADMVVLSACETGIGELSKGEGVISLSQAFFKAGAKSLITTLWRVSDYASADLMGRFYQQLKTGLPKDEALRNAKLDYLHHASARSAHPFFWAGFAAQGDMAPLSLGSQDFIWWICLFLLGLFVILGGKIRSKRLKAHAKN
ncbi:MAG: CHAT domain-containing protein [Phaeodactylibacter sp.]|nr:CHAT domain-containing protein [Phaeodactylibacter sp.]